MEEVFQTISRSLILPAPWLLEPRVWAGAGKRGDVPRSARVLATTRRASWTTRSCCRVAGELFGDQDLGRCRWKMDALRRLCTLLTLEDRSSCATRRSGPTRPAQSSPRSNTLLYPPEEVSEPAPAPRSFEYASRFLSTPAAMDACRDSGADRVPTPEGALGGGRRHVALRGAQHAPHARVSRAAGRDPALLATVDVPVPQATFSYLKCAATARERRATPAPGYRTS